MITFDSLILEEFIKEEKDFLIGARINKIQQPTRRELLLSLRNNGLTRKFYINIDPKFYHICFLSEANEKKRRIEMPAKPPMFCMLLRKYLENSKISKITQPEGERILELYVETYNELGDKIYLCLAIELMGKHSNVILYNTDTNLIIGCAHNVGADKSQVREVYGQIPYIYPPKQENNNYIKDHYAFLMKSNIVIFPENQVNRIIDDYYTVLTEKDKFKKLKSKYCTDTHTKLKKINTSLSQMESKLKSNIDSDKYRLYGDLLMANLYQLKDYSENVSLYDYENNKEITIDLNSSKTIKDNATKFYKKYNKAKTANIKLSEFISEYKHKKEYLESLEYSLNIAQNIDELLETITEIENKEDKKTNFRPAIEPIRIDLKDGSIIYIGKNNRQNDYIISKLASEDDLWFHTKDCPGSHVLLKTQNLTDELILKCAKLAKQYSSGSLSSKIGVIYTKRKYLRKPPKANLGYVTYRNEKEIIID